MSKKHLNYFSESEMGSVEKYCNWRDRCLNPILRLLDRCGVTPDAISLFSLIVMGGFVYFANINIYYALLFVVAHVLLDCFDGSLARYKKTASNKGAIFDIVVDQMAMVIGVLTLIYFGAIDPFWASLYMVSYIVMITFLVALNAIKAPVKYVIRTKYFFFIILFVDAYFKTQWINPFLTIFAVYMTITAIYLVSKFRSSV